ncbi:MAG: glycosyltransferase [Candidatus Taylorbacteria bacterium]
MISFIIPTFNEESSIEKTLKSISGFHGAHEIIVSDDESTDKTREIAKQYASAVLIHSEKGKKTIGANRNFGARNAQGEYLVFLDSDTYLESDPDLFLNKALQAFEENPSLVALTVFVRVSKTNETFLDKICFGGVNYLYFILNNVLHIGGSSGKFQMIRSNSFREAQGYNEELSAAEDYDLFVRLAKLGKTRVERTLAVYHSGRRVHAVGWPKLLSLWFLNTLSVTFLKKSMSKNWNKAK